MTVHIVGAQPVRWVGTYGCAAGIKSNESGVGSGSAGRTAHAGG